MELIDIVDENNELTGQIEDRVIAYEKGLWRRTVSCWIMNKDGKILLQKRSANKLRNPNKWAKTGGQVDSGESVEDAIFREVKEELGIEIPKEQIQVLECWKSKDINNKRFAYNFIFIVDYKIEDYKLQKEEVSEVKYFTIEEMEQIKKNNDLNYTFCKWDDDDFYREIEMLKQKRKFMNIRLANNNDLEEINRLYKLVIEDLNNIKNIDMLWNDVYPFCEFEYDISNNQMYIIENQNKVIGAFALSTYDDPNYHNIEWTSNKKWMYLNRLAILPSEQGKGFAKNAIEFVQDYSINNKYDTIRLTVYKDNKYAIGLYEKYGFIKVEKGYCQLEDKIYVGYEKKLTNLMPEDNQD